MVQGLQKAKSAQPSKQGKRLAARVISGFEEAMDDDLDVKAAFNRLFKTVSKLDSLNKAGRLGVEDANAALESLRRVDLVLEVVF
jgi:cysteinyl-tRNA synthetase